MKGDTLYVWQERDPAGWGVIASLVAPGMFGPLQTRDENIARHTFGPMAQRHSDETGREIRLVKMETVEVIA